MIIAIIRNNFSIRQVFAGPDPNILFSKDAYQKYVNAEIKNWFEFACGGILMHKKIPTEYRAKMISFSKDLKREKALKDLDAYKPCKKKLKVDR